MATTKPIQLTSPVTEVITRKTTQHLRAILQSDIANRTILTKNQIQTSRGKRYFSVYKYLSLIEMLSWIHLVTLD